MSKQIIRLLYALPLFLAVGCDTTEDAFHVGGEPQKTQFLNVDLAQLTFSPEGATYEIHITSIASWEVALIDNNANQFSVSPTSGRGNGTVLVEAKSNPSPQSHTANLQFKPINFDMDPVTVALRQTNTTFSIDTYPSGEVIPEEGGSVTMTAYSSLNWVLDVVSHDADGNLGDPEWLDITPGLSGEGKDGNSPQEFRFSWKPNYTNTDRVIRFQLKPSSGFEEVELPRPITLFQSAGTYPQSLRCVIEKINIVDAEITLEYSSRSPVNDCGIYLYNVGAGGEETLVDTFRPKTTDGEFAKNGLYTISMPELTEDTQFRIIPFAVNEVGMSTGDPREFSTGIKPENMVYKGVDIVNGNDGLSIEAVSDPEYLTANAKISAVITSDVEPLQNRIASAVLSVNGKQVNGIPTSIDEESWLYVFNVTDLVPNTEYSYTLTVISSELPRELGQMRQNTATASGSFKTPGFMPGENDNDKPNSGE